MDSTYKFTVENICVQWIASTEREKKYFPNRYFFIFLSSFFFITSPSSHTWAPNKKGSELLRRYPVSTSLSTVVAPDTESVTQHEKAITAELSRSYPRDTVLPLIKSTYHSRRMFILNEAVSVDSILHKYPALCYATVVHLCTFTCLFILAFYFKVDSTRIGTNGWSC